MINIKYANAYSELLEILKYLPIEDYNKIPSDEINLYKSNCNKNYIFNFNPSKTLDEQNVSKITKVLIGILFRDYWATPVQREKIIKTQKYQRNKINEEKQIKYDPNDIFKDVQTGLEKNNSIENENCNLPSKVEKENIFTKIKNWFKRIFEK